MVDLDIEQQLDATQELIVDALDEESRASDSRTKTVQSSAASLAAAAGSSSEAGAPPIIAEKYQVIEKLGSGGISSVYKVKHLHLGKIYALKLLHELKEESVLRFQQEAKAASMLQHQNIVGVVDFGIFNGKPYMVMNCVEGQTLSRYAKCNPPPSPVNCVRLFGEVCAALAHAHEKGVVHRDIKPSNIMISLDENQVEHAIVVDFGIAKVTNEELDNSSLQITRTGDIFGTPLYMSPEQCRGLAVDPRSDIYSLGCVMYEVLSGAPPFTGDSPYEIIHKQITESPKPFSAELRRSQVTARMEGIILKSMAKSAHDRFQYMLEMSSAIKAVELGARGSNRWLSGWNFAMARFRASDRQQAVLKMGILAASILTLCFALVLAFAPAEIGRLSNRIKIENEIIEGAKGIFTFRYDQGASLFRISRHATKVKLREIRELAKIDKEISRRFEDVAKKCMNAADKISELRGLKRAVSSDAPAGMLSHLATLRQRLDDIEARLGQASNYWSEANLKSVELSNSISRQVESEERRKWLWSLMLLASQVLLFPAVAVLLFSSYVTIAERRKEKVQFRQPPASE